MNRQSLLLGTPLLGALLLGPLLAGAVLLNMAAAQQCGTPADAKAMVAKAIELYDATSAAEAFKVMNQGEATGFLEGDIYIFAFSTGPSAKVVVQAADQNRVGLDVASLKDSAGKLYGEEILKQATPDGAWVDYMRLNPSTQKEEQKSSWVVLHDGYVFGCGIYKTP